MPEQTVTKTKAMHTLGPWEVQWGSVRHSGQREHVGRCVIGTPKNVHGGRYVVAAIDGPFLGDRTIAKANANLIAAAPDLLEAARAFVEWYNVDSTEQKRDDAFYSAQAAIAKAEGR
jgi:hypothetical protein